MDEKTINQTHSGVGPNINGDVTIYVTAGTIEKVTDQTATLVQFGFDLIFKGYLTSIKSSKLTLIVADFIKGDFDGLKDFCKDYKTLSPDENFIIIESESDARTLNDLEFICSTKELVLDLLPNTKIEDVNKIGFSLSFENGDLSIENGKLKTVSGKDLALQQLSIALGLVKGEYFLDSSIGSLVSQYYWDYKHDLALLSKLIKLEYIRLSRIIAGRQQKSPPLNFIKRFDSVTVKSEALEDNQITLLIDLTFSDDELWSGEIKVHIADQEHLEKVKEKSNNRYSQDQPTVDRGYVEAKKVDIKIDVDAPKFV
ncbi:hypothetical protein [Piscirickettsia litoralis]|uniref:Uncharacterized protein n=1 Tax=Piscirickettsia litoralis TaxID=1891921 RepID=A0ABX2ZWY6_9GAMM|nr:hypothetical protein [Piscirickettsia litoralis]ODN41111.1 hypothetical protein BGC07_17705 [Piscirickettsia litoralis]